ncbi:TetR/AcrR family transcriptional regulator [Streptomonospora sediminis]
MARSKEFNPEIVLDTAMRLFWRKGYEGTSTTDLVEELGISRASLYGTFGSKRELYLAALDRFVSGGGGPSAADILAAHESALESVRAFLETSVTASEPDGPEGCFAVNATVEHGTVDPEVSRRLESDRRRTETALYSVLLRGRAEGELAPGVDPKTAASMLVAVNSGLKVLARAGVGQHERIRATIDTTMAMLAP